MSNHASLTVALPEALDAFVRQRVASGRFASASDVVLEALTLLARREHDRDAALDEIRREIQLGIDRMDTVKVIHDREGQSWAIRGTRRRSRWKRWARRRCPVEAVSPLTTIPTRR